jgi:hypothetical protein
MNDSDNSALFNELIPEMREMRRGGEAIDVHDWLAVRGSYELAVAFGQLFWPRFVLFEDCVFWAPGNPELFKTWIVQLGGDKPAVEAMMNHRHIIDLFPRASPATPQQLIYLGKLLRDIWSCKLARDFPDRTFEVVFTEGAPADLVGYQVTFCQRRLDSAGG